MTNRELVNIYLASIGMKRVGGKSDAGPLLPFLILDAVYQVYCEEIRPLPAKHLMKKNKTDWKNAYARLNHEFFLPFKGEQKDEVIERMDAFEDYISNDMMITKLSVMDCLGDVELEKQKVIGACMLCNILAQAAQYAWGAVYKSALGKALRNAEIETIQRKAYELANMLHDSTATVSLNDSEKVHKAVDALCRKMVRWCYLDEQLKQ